MHELHQDHRHACLLGKSADFTLPGSQAHYPPSLELEPVHIDIDFHVHVDDAALDGTVTHTVRAARSGPRSLTLHAVRMELRSVEDADGRGLEHTYDGRELSVTWADPFEHDEERRLVIRYRVEEPAAGLYFSSPSDAYPDAPRYAATDNETEHARHWLPTVDLPSVRPKLDFHLRSDASFEILANGAHAGTDDHGDGTKTVHWKLEQPCPSYLTCFALGDFVRADDGEFEGRPVAYFTSREFSRDDLMRSFGRTRDMLAWLTEKLDFAFPYPKYYQFALPGFGGAMENISLVAWDDRFVLGDDLAPEWTWLVDQINIHEMGHSYFGDLITCRDYAHAWLKESWATYTETLWLEHSKGADECDYDWYSNVQAYLGEADTAYKRPIVTRDFNHSWQMYDRHLYPGGGSRLHMLRKELGDATFFDAVRTYVKRFAFKTVETSDFRRTLEEVSGRSLGKWFDQWIHGKGYPSLKASYSYDKEKGEASLTVEQTQEDAKEGVPVFELPLDLGWVVDGTLHTETVKLERAKHTFVFKVPGKPQMVRVDPHNRTVMKLEFNPGGDLLRTQLRDAPDVVGRIRAGNALCDEGGAKNIAAVRDAYRVEPFWGVRVRFAQALARTGSQAAVDALADLLGTEEDPMVLEHLVRAAGAFRDAGVREALEARLDAGIPFPRARLAALDALGKQRTNAPFDRLLDAAQQPGDRYGLTRMGGLFGLAETRDERALEVLTEATRCGGASNRVRPAAAQALGLLARHLPRPARERASECLVDLLRDPIDRVRAGAVVGISQLGPHAPAGALEAYKATLSEQEGVTLDRTLSRIRQARAAEPGGKDKRVEDLQDLVRKLSDRLDKLEARHAADDKAADEPGAA